MNVGLSKLDPKYLSEKQSLRYVAEYRNGKTEKTLKFCRCPDEPPEGLTIFCRLSDAFFDFDLGFSVNQLRAFANNVYWGNILRRGIYELDATDDVKEEYKAKLDDFLKNYCRQTLWKWCAKAEDLGVEMSKRFDIVRQTFGFGRTEDSAGKSAIQTIRSTIGNTACGLLLRSYQDGKLK